MIGHLISLYQQDGIEGAIKAMRESYEAAKQQSIMVPSLEGGINNENRWANEFRIVEETLWKNFSKKDLVLIYNSKKQVEEIFMRHGIMPTDEHNTGKYRAIDVLNQLVCFAEIVF